LSFLHDSMTNLLPLLHAFEPLLEAAAKSAEAKLAPSKVVDECRALMINADLDFTRGELPLAIQQSLDGVAQIKKIVLAMKEFSHPGNDEKEALDVNRAIEATVLVARNEWKYVAEVELALDRTIPHVDVIPASINQVDLNLVVNAAHAIEDVVRDSGAKGKIRISTRRVADAVEVAVEDTGCGIPADNVSRIFDPFFTTKKVGKGTGQGLAIVRRVVVDRHGGTVDVHSTVGKGTCFRVRLPLGPAEDTQELRTA